MKPIKPTRMQAQQARAQFSRQMAERLAAMLPPKNWLTEGFPPLIFKEPDMDATITQAEAADIREAVLHAASQSPMEPEVLVRSLIEAFGLIREAASQPSEKSAD